MSNDVSKLPKWAQARLESLERALAEERERGDALLGQLGLVQNADTVTRVLRQVTPLPGYRVRWQVGAQREEYLEATLEGDHLELRSGASRITISPDSSNRVTVRVNQ